MSVVCDCSLRCTKSAHSAGTFVSIIFTIVKLIETGRAWAWEWVGHLGSWLRWSVD